MLRFSSPWWFAVLPLATLLLVATARNRRRQPVVAPWDLAGSPVRRSLVERTRFLPATLSALALVLVVVSLARPQWGEYRTQVETEGINIVLALDVSESMSALDFKKGGAAVDRLTAVKAVVRDFVGGRVGDRIGIVVFGSAAYTQAPLTRDTRALETVIDGVRIGAAGKSTAVGDAIGIALKRLEDVPSPSNVIILLTDGRSNTGEIDPRTAANIAASRGVKIYTIGVGGREAAPFVIDDPVFGRRTVYQRVEIDEELLDEIAAVTGAKSFRAENLPSLEAVYDEIGRLETSTVTMRQYDDFHDRYLWALVPAVLFMASSFVLRATRYQEIP